MTNACIQLQAVRDIAIHVQNGGDQYSSNSVNESTDTINFMLYYFPYQPIVSISSIAIVTAVVMCGESHDNTSTVADFCKETSMGYNLPYVTNEINGSGHPPHLFSCLYSMQ